MRARASHGTRPGHRCRRRYRSSMREDEAEKTPRRRGKTSYRRRRRRGSRGGSERRRRHRRARARRRANAAGYPGSRHRSHASRRASECRDSAGRSSYDPTLERSEKRPTSTSRPTPLVHNSRARLQLYWYWYTSAIKTYRARTDSPLHGVRALASRVSSSAPSVADSSPFRPSPAPAATSPRSVPSGTAVSATVHRPRLDVRGTSRDSRVPRRSQRTRRRFISLAHPRRVRLEPTVELEVTSMQQRRGARRRRARAPLRRHRRVEANRA